MNLSDEQFERILMALRKANIEMSVFAKDLGGCDHSVGICQCQLNADCEEVSIARFLLEELKQQSTGRR